jgi:hypothetical protein
MPWRSTRRKLQRPHLLAWLQLRYDHVLGYAPLAPAVAVQFLLDHLARLRVDGSRSTLLPAAVDGELVKAWVKGKLGPLAFNTVSHRSNGTGSMAGTVRLKRRR